MVYMVKLVDEKPSLVPPASTGIPEKKTPATKKDIEELGDRLIWPPPFTRDLRLNKMQTALNDEDAVMQDTSLSDTEKVLRVAELKQQYNVHDNELFGAKRLGAVPNKPLRMLPPNDTVDMKDESDSETLNGMDTDEEETEEDEQSITDEDSDDSEDDIQALYPHDELLENIKPYRKQNAKAMLKKLTADGRLRWDGRGNVFYKDRQVPGANIKQLVNYFQTAHRKRVLPNPAGKNIFGQALRHAHANEDVLLGGKQDERIRTIFKGYPPKTPGFRASRKPPQSSPTRTPRSIKRRRVDNSKVVTHLES